MAFSDPIDFAMHQVATDIESELITLERLCLVADKLFELDARFPEGTEVSSFVMESTIDTVETLALSKLSITDELFSLENISDGVAVAKNIGKVALKIVKGIIDVLLKVGKLGRKFWQNFLGAAATRLKEANEIAAEISATKKSLVLDPNKEKIKQKPFFSTVANSEMGDVNTVDKIEESIEALIGRTNPSAAQDASISTLERILRFQERDEGTMTAGEIAVSHLDKMAMAYDLVQTVAKPNLERHVIKFPSLSQVIVMDNYIVNHQKIAPSVTLAMTDTRKLPSDITAARPEAAAEIISLAQSLLDLSVKQGDVYSLDRDLSAVVDKIKQVQKDDPESIVKNNLLREVPKYTRFAFEFTKVCANAKLRVGTDLIQYVRASSDNWVKK